MKGSQSIKGIVYSGVQSSGRVHLGNYLGALRNWKKLQDNDRVDEAYFAVVDLHSLVTHCGDALTKKKVSATKFKKPTLLIKC